MTAMTPGDAARLLALVQSFDHRNVAETDVAAWADALENLDPADCAEAIRRFFRDRTDWLMPAHVRQGVRQLLERRHDEQVTREIEAGHSVDTARAKAAFQELVEPVIATLTAREPAAAAGERRVRTVACPWPPCLAKPGNPCTTVGEQRAVSHPARYEAASVAFPSPNRSELTRVRVP